jgi:hypothetical protein
MPKKHVANFFDLPLSEQAECWQVVNKVQQWLQVRYAPDGFNVGLNIGVAGGQITENLVGKRGPYARFGYVLHLTILRNYVNFLRN